MLRVKIELVPHGNEKEAEVLDTVIIANDGTGRGPVGPNEGGIGNYDVFDNETVDHLNVVDYPSMYSCGRIEGVERTPDHRIYLAAEAINTVREARDAGHQNAKPVEPPGEPT